MTLESKIKKMLLTATAALPLFITACGGGGSSPTAPTPTPTPNPTPTSKDYSISGVVTETFTNAPLGGIPVVAVCTSGPHSGTTDGSGSYRLTWQANLATDNCTEVKYNITEANQWGNQAFVAQLVKEKMNPGSLNINIDMPEYAKLFEGHDPKAVIEVYRGRRADVGSESQLRGINQVWTHQPSTWRIYDPESRLNAYSDKRNNPVFNTVWKAWQSACDYSNGVVNMPDRNAVELRIGEKVPPILSITDEMVYAMISPYASEVDRANNNHELFLSGAEFNIGGNADERDAIAEARASFQGGDNESNLGYTDCIFNGICFENAMPQMHKNWSRFNYRLRLPGEQMLPSGNSAPSPYGFPVEIRKK
jgi:hypothetical protein